MTEDIFVPKSAPEDALVGPLHTVTYVTGDKQRLDKALRRGYGLTSTGWLDSDKSDLAAISQYLGIPLSENWQYCCYNKAGTGSNVQVRVLSVDGSMPAIRPAYDGLHVGGATISFPIEDLRAHEQIMRTLGFSSTVGVKEMEFQSPTGETYISAEIVYEGPDNIFLLGVTRPPIFVPVGPIDPETGMGGAAYSARCTQNTNATVEFLEVVLGYEIRRDVAFSVGEKSAINLPEGTTERFVQAFAPGSSTGYLVLMDHGERTKAAAAPSHAPPNRGIGIWSFPTKDLAEVHTRALKHGASILKSPALRVSPGIPETQTLLLQDPDGMLIEVFAGQF